MSASDAISIRLHNCAGVADEMGQHQTALIMWRRAQALCASKETKIAIALQLLFRGDDESASELATDVLKGPGNAETLAWAWLILGRIHTIHGRLSEAVDAMDHAIACEPGNIQILFDLASAHLRAGNTEIGWPLATAANRGWIHSTAITPPFPRWDGSPTDDLLIISRLGFGDNVMLARFLPWAKQRAKRLTVMCRVVEEPLYMPWMRYGAIDEVINTPTREYSHLIENFVLTELANCDLNNPPPIFATNAVTRVAQNKQLKVGIAWSGSDQTATNPIRRVPFDVMLSLAENPRIDLYSLQCGKRAADIAQAHAQVLVRDLSGQIEMDWSLTANALKQLDLFVSPDCGPAHLAGAMGIPTLLMLSSYPDWRWGVGRSDSPWYPSMRLFRQTRLGDWKPVIEQIKQAIAELEKQNADRSRPGESVGQTA